MKIQKSLNSLNDIELIREHLSDKPRDLLLFDLGSQTGLKMIDLLSLKVKDVKYLNIGDIFPFSGGQAAGLGGIRTTKALSKTIQNYLSETGASDNDYLFRSRKSSNPISITSASRLVKSWFQSAGFKGETGARSLQKAWALYFCDEVTMRESNATFKIIKTVTIQESVYRELFQAIISGRILPGQKLIASKIANEMGVSLIPVREAMVRLKGTGLLYSDKTRGFVTNEFSEKNIREISKTRILLECLAAEKGTKNCSSENLNRLEIIQQQITALSLKNKTDEILKLNYEFHFIIYHAADMPILLNIIEGLWTKVSPYLHMYSEKTTLHDIDSVLIIHGGMLKGMKERSPQTVKKWIKVDISQAKSRVLSILGSLQKNL